MQRRGISGALMWLHHDFNILIARHEETQKALY
jgi:hypothetical protein